MHEFRRCVDHDLKEASLRRPVALVIRAGYAEAGVVDEHIDGEAAFGQGGTQCFDGGRVGQVGRDAVDVDAVLGTQACGECLQSVDATRRQDQMAATRGGHLRISMADAGRGAGDQGALSAPVEVRAHELDQLPQGRAETILRALSNGNRTCADR